ncbi:hypothetical protein HK57_00709 [Aspergillus ustus]|uniref:Uncharacterized protein n=1 Tax=Aspergillus ustus TaxID=40382 RepID=A0A0C1C3A8_ASPUT|nr:hypothetical protein HK57_00709 [Aspergillus ustus]
MSSSHTSDQNADPLFLQETIKYVLVGPLGGRKRGGRIGPLCIAAVGTRGGVGRVGKSGLYSSEEEEEDGEKEEEKGMTLFERIVQLRVGEALLFAPSAIVGVRDGVGDDQDGGGGGEQGQEAGFERWGGRSLKITVRARLTEDGGKSILSQ